MKGKGITVVAVTAVTMALSAAAVAGVVRGTAGNDQLPGTEQADLIRGFAGDDALTGLGASATIRAGEVFTVASVFAVNPQSRTSTGVLAQFVVTADVALGATSIPISCSPTADCRSSTVRWSTASGVGSGGSRVGSGR